MDAVRADEPVCGSERTLQMLGNIRRRQISKRPAAGRSFDIDAQARRIIGENARAGIAFREFGVRLRVAI